MLLAVGQLGFLRRQPRRDPLRLRLGAGRGRVLTGGAASRWRGRRLDVRHEGGAARRSAEGESPDRLDVRHDGSSIPVCEVEQVELG
eukprot:1915146-Pleurochrysis_carterae.AAC.1